MVTFPDEVDKGGSVTWRRLWRGRGLGDERERERGCGNVWVG